jgi:thiamine biosynthesis lipoprotein
VKIMKSNVDLLPSSRLHLYDYSFAAMGTMCTLHLYSDSQMRADMLAALAVAEVERIEKKYSRYAQDSALSTINRASVNDETVCVDEETAGLLGYAFACHKNSGGLFDITTGVFRRVWDFSSGQLPKDSAIKELLSFIGMDKLIWTPPNLNFAVRGMELDFGGIGKEYAVDRVATLLADESVKHGLINLGGDMYVLGPHPNGQAWKVGLRDPHYAQEIIGEVALFHGGLTTSGNYERCFEIHGTRYSHILSPLTGWPVQGLSSVTVLAPQCMLAGSLTTIALLKGNDGIQWLADLGVPHRWINENEQQGGTLPLV